MFVRLLSVTEIGISGLFSYTNVCGNALHSQQQLGFLILFSVAVPSREEDGSRPTEAGSNMDYSSLNMTSLNANVHYETIHTPTYVNY